MCGKAEQKEDIVLETELEEDSFETCEKRQRRAIWR